MLVRARRGARTREEIWETSCKTVSKMREMDAVGQGQSYVSSQWQPKRRMCALSLGRGSEGPDFPPRPWEGDCVSRTTKEGRVKGPLGDHPPTHRCGSLGQSSPRPGACPQGAYGDRFFFSPTARRLSDVLKPTRLMGSGAGTRSPVVWASTTSFSRATRTPPLAPCLGTLPDCPCPPPPPSTHTLLC